MPYAPGISYRGDQYLFEGISSLGKSIGDGIRRFRDDKAESQAADSAYETMLQLGGPDLLKPSADGKAPKIDELGQFAGLSLSQKKAKLGQLGVMMQLARQNRQDEESAKYHAESLANQKAGVELSRGQLIAQDLARQDRRAAGDQQRVDAQAVARDTVGALMMLSGQSGLPSPVNPEQPGEYVRQQFPNADPAEVGRWMRENAGGPNRLPQRMNLDGVDVVASPHTGQFQVLREQTEKAPPAPNYDWVLSDDPAVFAQGVLNLAPEQIKEVLARRNAFNRAMGRDVDPIKQIAARMLGGKAPGETPAGAPAGNVKVWNPKTRRAE